MLATEVGWQEVALEKTLERKNTNEKSKRQKKSPLIARKKGGFKTLNHSRSITCATWKLPVGSL